MSRTNDPIDLLSKLISLFEENERELTDVPDEAVKQYGYPCLANSLMFKEPNLPNYDKENISKYITKHNFPTIDSLCDYIQSLEDDINKLFAIFCWEALNIQFDVNLYFSHNHEHTSLEKVFKTKLAGYEGYSLFFNEIAKRVKINESRIKISNYSNMSKSNDFDPLNPPSSAKSNHASVYIEIDGAPFICEPAYGAGIIDSEKKFCPKFNPNFFLIPIYKTLSYHYPCDESSKLLPISFPYSDYLKSIKIGYNYQNIKTESNPFIKIDCKDGYLEQIYSSEGNIFSVSFQMSIQKNNKFENVHENGIIGYEIIQKQLPKHPERCRFRVNIAFPQKGLFNIIMFINTHYILNYYVNSLCKSSRSIPINYNPYKNEKFIPILPKTQLTYVESNYTLIRFAVAKEKAPLLCYIKNSNGESLDSKYYSYVTYKIPFDSERYEDMIFINFPSNGRFSVEVFLKINNNDIGPFMHYITYFFDVKIVNENAQMKSISDFIYRGRDFSDIEFVYDNNHEFFMRPSASFNLITENIQYVDIKTESVDDEIHLNLRKDEETLFPVFLNKTNDQFRRYQLSFSKGFGEYKLLGWINDSIAINVKYIYQKSFQDPPHEENQIMNELKMKINEENISPKPPITSTSTNDNEIIEQLKSQIASQQKKYESQITAQQQKFKSKIASQQKKYESQITAQQQEFKSKIASQQKKYESLRQNYESKIASQQEKHERELLDKKNELNNLKNQLEEIKKKIKEQEESENPKKGTTLQILDLESINKYETEEEIGSGGGGRVIKVFEKKYYALKIMNIKKGETSNFRRFLREYEIINMLNHPNIIKTYGFFLSDKKIPPSILLEYCDTNLEEIIRNKKLTNIDIAFTIYQIAEGMKYVHHQKIIHRDIKPSNILISNDGTIKICDFGISKLMSIDEQSSTGGVGTQKYMAPEIINEEKYDEKVDVYSFGVLIYFVLNEGDISEIKIRNIVLGKKTPLPSQFTEFSRQLINSCWNFDPKGRPTFEQIIEDLSHNNFNLIELSKSELQEVESLVKKHKKLIPSY